MSTAVRPRYKLTELGVIPEDWEASAVSFRGEVVTGKALAVKGPGPQRPYLRTKNVFDGKIIVDDVLTMPMTEAEFSHFEVRHDDLLLNEGQSLELVGRCARYRGEYGARCAIQNQLLRFRANPGTSPLFAEQLFRHCQHTGVFARIALQTTSIAHLGGKRFGHLILAWPTSIEEQRRIGSALADFDEASELIDRLIAKKRDLKQAAMQVLLSGGSRLPGHQGQWEAKRLGQLGSFLKGSGIRKDEAIRGELRCVRYGELYTHHNDWIKSYHSRVSPSVAANALRLRAGDILFAGSGETKAEIGKCAAFLDTEEAYADGDIVVLRPAGVDSLFLGYLLNTPDVARQKASRGQGDAVVHIGASSLGAVEVVLPPLAEQTAIAFVLSDMDAEIAALERRRDKTKQLKQAMMEELLTGRTRLV